MKPLSCARNNYSLYSIVLTMLVLPVAIFAASKATQAPTNYQLISAIHANNAKQLKQWLHNNQINMQRRLTPFNMTPFMLATWLKKSSCATTLRNHGATNPFIHHTKAQTHTWLRARAIKSAGLLHMQRIFARRGA